jgi:site-specific DNA-methyltransferase (adenine-specific)
LPYGTTACKWDTIIPFEPLWEQYKRIIKDNGAIVLTASQPFTSALVMSNTKMFKYEWVWEKTKASNFQLAKYNPMKVHENILVFYNKTPIYNQHTLEVGEFKNSRDSISQMTNLAYRKKEYVSKGKGYNKSIIKVNSEQNPPHPTQKPVALFEYLIKTYTNEGDLVLDNCAGSGTTGVACINTNRNYILIEKEPEYIKIIKERLENVPDKLF